MKIFILAVIVTFLCLSFVAAGTVYTSTAIKNLTRAADALPEFLTEGENTPEDVLRGVDNALNIWRSASKMTLMGVSHGDYDEVEGILVSMRTAALCGEAGAFANYLASLKEKLKRLSVSEGISLDGIL